MINIKDGLTYDDILLAPAYSDISSRSEVNLSVELPKGFKVKHPIIPANMVDTSGWDMSNAVYNTGGLSILHRFMPIEEQLELLNYFYKHNQFDYIGFSIGAKAQDYIYADRLVNAGVKILCIDIAHGDSKMCVNMCDYISKKYPDVLLIAGNVATGSGAYRLWEAGADVVKVGVGSGSICTTRIETGSGVPQFSALIDVLDAKEQIQTKYKDRKFAMIADGGITTSGNCVKALAIADMIMSGGLFSGCAESPGKSVSIDGILYKEYSGSSTYKDTHIEGVKGLSNIKGSVKDIISKLLDGISSGCSYQGARNLTELKDNPQFVRITNAGLIESHPHNIKVVK